MLKKSLLIIVISGTGFATGVVLTDITRVPKAVVNDQVSAVKTSNNITATIINKQMQTSVSAIDKPDVPEFVAVSTGEAGANEDELNEAEINIKPADADEELSITLALAQQLTAERNSRQQLEMRVSSLNNQLQALEQRLEQLALQQQKTDNSTVEPGATQNQTNVGTLISAGFAPAQAALITQTLGQQEMELLYLRDQAIREGWLDTPQYREASQELRQARSQLWDELGTEARDRYLYATGQSNRVQVEQVIGSSPAQALGLQAGDVIVSYDGTPIYSGSDLRSATSNGVPEEQVMMQIMRGGQRIEFYISRGPIGVRLSGVSLEPQS